MMSPRAYCVKNHRRRRPRVAANFPRREKRGAQVSHQAAGLESQPPFRHTDKYALIAAFDKTWTGALPYTVLLGAKGELLYKQEGPIEGLELKREILKALGREMKR